MLEPDVPPAAPPRPSPWRRRALAALGVAMAAPALLVAAASFHLRHVPWSVPAAQRPPTPAPGAAGGLWVRYLGVSGYEVTDGATTLLLDPTFTRPTARELLLPVESDAALVAKETGRADFVLVNHTHHDHALDVPEVAKRTGAVVLGSPSTLNLCRARGVDPSRLREARAGERLTLGTFTVDVRASRHTAIGPFEEPMAGVVAPDAGRLWFWQLTQDGCLAYRLSAGGTTLWFHPTSTYAPGELGGLPAANLILGITGEPMTPEKARGAIGEARARRVLPTHYDNFLQPLSAGLALMPGLDLDAALAAIGRDVEVWLLDHRQQVHLPPD